MAETILERPSEGVALIRINRPEQLNALNMAVRIQLAEHFVALTADESVRAIVLTGNEKAFAAGADIKEMAELNPIEVVLRRSHRALEAINACPKPIIAAINGFALGGGCEIAMHCDIIIAGEGAQFGQPEVRVGIIPGGGGTQRLTRTIGKYQAMKMCLTGKPVTAREALAMGLASEVVPDAEVLDTALKMASTIAAMPPLAVAAIKEVIIAGQNASLDTALLLERKAFQLLFASEDQKEGMRAFAEKRRPHFKGR